MFGIDVSEHNGLVDFEKMKKAGFDFAIIRTGYSDKEDSMFKANSANAYEAGLKVGAYHYSYALNPSQAMQEAFTMREIIDNTGMLFEMPMFFDMENDVYKGAHNFDYSSENITDICRGFLNNIGLNAGVYAPFSWLNSGKIDWQSLRCPIWSAQWNIKDDFKGYMWQFSDSWEIGGKIFDVNYCYNEV